MSLTAPSHTPGGPTCGDPDARQRICIHLIALYEALSLLMNIDPAMLPIVDLVVPHDGITIGADLDACQCITCGKDRLEQDGTLLALSVVMSYYSCCCCYQCVVVVPGGSRQICMVTLN